MKKIYFFCFISGLSFNTELLGIGRGKDALPTTVLAPPSVFPPLTVKAKQTLKNDESEYLLSLAKDFRYITSFLCVKVGSKTTYSVQ